MKNQIKIYFLIIATILFFNLAIGWCRTESDNYIIWADTFSVGGSESDNSTNYKMQDTIGEAMAWSATNTAATYGIKAGFRELYPDQFLTFSVDATAVDLGKMDSSRPGTDSHTMTIDTNSTLGFTITVSGAGLKSGGNEIDAIGAAAAASTPGTEQFGINLVANTLPIIGADPTGDSPVGSAAGQYGLVNKFAFYSGDTVASSSNDINSTVFTVSYIANILANTPAGNYSTTLAYSVTANF